MPTWASYLGGSRDNAALCNVNGLALLDPLHDQDKAIARHGVVIVVPDHGALHRVVRLDAVVIEVALANLLGRQRNNKLLVTQTHTTTKEDQLVSAIPRIPASWQPNFPARATRFLRSNDQICCQFAKLPTLSDQRHRAHPARPLKELQEQGSRHLSLTTFPQTFQRWEAQAQLFHRRQEQG